MLRGMFVQEDKERFVLKKVDQDGLWKKLIADVFEEFILFFMPALHSEIDFTEKVQFLDKELFQEIVDAQKGRRYVDQLAQVRLRSGEKKWILIHVEVQSGRDKEFGARMFQYFYRIFDRYAQEIVAIAVHTYPEAQQEMEHFEYEFFGTKLTYTYNNYKVNDYSDEALLGTSNIFSRAVLAAKAVHSTKDKIEQRYQFKQNLMRALIRDQHQSRESIVALLHFIDYLLYLPEKETASLSKVIGPYIKKERGIMELFNKDNSSPTVLPTMADLWDEAQEGRKKGREEGREEGVALAKRNLTKKLLAKNYPIDEIIELTELSRSEVEEIQREDN